MSQKYRISEYSNPAGMTTDISDIYFKISIYIGNLDNSLNPNIDDIHCHTNTSHKTIKIIIIFFHPIGRTNLTK